MRRQSVCVIAVVVGAVSLAVTALTPAFSAQAAKEKPRPNYFRNFEHHIQKLDRHAARRPNHHTHFPPKTP